MPNYPSFLLPDDSVKVRFKEPQVSQALNMKTDGIVPPGIYNGFTPNVGADPNVLLLNTDPYRNDSVAVGNVYNLNGAIWTADYNLTIRTTLQVQLDFTGHTVFPCWVVLRPAYSIVAHPFSGLTNAQVVTINDLTVDDTDALALHHGDVKICRVNSTGPVVYATTSVNRDDNGGHLVTQADLAVASAYAQVVGTYTFASNTACPGSFGSFTPAATLTLTGFRTGQLVCLSVVGSAYCNTNDGTVTLGFKVDGTPTGNISGTPGDMITRTVWSAIAFNNASYSIWTTVSAGSHTFELCGVYASNPGYVLEGTKFTVTRF